MKQVLHSERGPEAKGPYSHAVACGDLIFLSGQIAVDPQTGEVVRGDIETEATQALTNVRTVLEDCGTSLENVVKVTVFLADMDNFGKVNEIYRRFFGSDFPARSCVQVARLPLDAQIEVEALRGHDAESSTG